MIDPFDMNESMDLVEFLRVHSTSRTIPIGGLHKHFFDWDRDTQNDYLTSLFERAKTSGRWMFMDPSGIPETVSKATYDFFMERIGELARR